MPTEPNYYAVLGVSPESEDIVIQAAYRALMRRYHPDKNPSAEAAQKTIQINAAYAVLGDATARAAYDVRRKSKESQRKSSSGAGAKPPPPPPPPPSPPPHPSEPEPPATRARSGDSAAGLIFASLITILIIGAIGFGASKATIDIANNTMNVDENLTTTDMNSTTMDSIASDMNVPGMPDSGNVEANADAALNAAGELSPALGTHVDLSDQPSAAVDYSTIEDAARRVAKIIATKGMAGARTYSESCHKAVQASPSWSGADGCAAFDYAAASIDAAVTSQAGWPRNGYFDFQSSNQSDQYAAVGVSSYRTYDRLPKIRNAAQQAGLDAFRTEIARQNTISRMRGDQQTTSAAGNSTE